MARLAPLNLNYPLSLKVPKSSVEMVPREARVHLPSSCIVVCWGHTHWQVVASMVDNVGGLKAAAHVWAAGSSCRG